MKRYRSLVIWVVAMLFGLALIVAFICTPVSLTEAAVNWTEYSLNPVLEDGDPGAWDEGGVGAASVIRDGATYKMWYTGQHVSPWPEIGYATSSNGNSWTKHGTNPVLTKGTSGAWDDEGVGSSCVIWDDDDNLYKMWYTGTPDNTFGAIPAIGYATSSNGTSWTKYGTNPVLTAGTSGAWDDAGVQSPCVIKENATSYKMWYSGRSADGGIGSLQIGYATSSNGTSWTKSGSNPVLAKGTDPAWDSRGVGVGCVVEIDGDYQMWYTGYKGTGEGGIEVAIGSASSSNGISWSNRGRELTKGTGWEENGVGAPWIIHSGSTYRMWFTGLDTNFDITLGYASYTTPAPNEPDEEDELPSVTADVSDYIDKYGVFTVDVTAESEDGDCRIDIGEGTTGLTDDGKPLNEISITTMEEPPPLPEDFPANVIGLTYDFKPKGATFVPPITVCFDYKTTDIPEGVNEKDLVIAIWVWDEEADEYKWEELEDCKVDAGSNTICASVSHFTPFAVLAYTSPASFVTSDLIITPEEVDIGETVTISISVANTGDLSDSYEVTMKVGDSVVATEDVTVAGGASQKVTFTIAKYVAGTYAVNVDRLTGTFVVKAAPPSSPSPSPLPPTVPLPAPAKLFSGWLIGGICAALVALAVVIWLIVARRRA